MSIEKGLQEGDELICVNDKVSYLKEGLVYKFVRYGAGGVYITGNNAIKSYCYGFTRFEKVEKTKEHPIKDVIVAWANGEKIQQSHISKNDWVDWPWDFNFTPNWHSYKWRIKPQLTQKELKIKEIQDKIDQLNKEIKQIKGE